MAENRLIALPHEPSEKVIDQIAKRGLPIEGQLPFKPLLVRSRKGDIIIKKDTVQHGPKKGKKGYVDEDGRIWVRDRGHANLPDHWDVQEDGGKTFLRIDDDGNEI